jgi:transketolase
MRRAFARWITERAEVDERVVLLTGDLGFTVLEPFAERHPDRFFNAGVAEQNMVGIATGLAEAGFVPFVYSIATFATLRPYEFIRNGPVLHELPVRIVGVGGGFDYGHNGISHYALEDVALMRVQPGMGVVVPADPAQTTAALDAGAEAPGPIYLRLGRESAPVPGLGARFEPGRLDMIHREDGSADVAVIALGTTARHAAAAAERLRERGVSTDVAVAASIAPAPVEDLAELLAGVSLAVTVEAHYTIGGLGSLVAETIAEQGLSCRLVRRGVERMPRGETGSDDYLSERFGLTPAAISEAVVRELSIAQR